jgi:hypothetical protein
LEIIEVRVKIPAATEFTPVSIQLRAVACSTYRTLTLGGAGGAGG